MTERFFGESIPKLGFGYMRLPMKDGKFDAGAVNEMVDAFMGYGFSYFDTAYIYTGSEEALRESLVKRYPRDKFQITTKLPLIMLQKPEQQMEHFETSLKRLGVDFVDTYFIHGLMGSEIKKAYEFDTWGFMKGLKDKGQAKHIGFSFHGTPEELDDILGKEKEMEMVQLQINYLDWDNPEVQSRRLYEVARKYNMPISIMEPTKGGLLASEESEASKLLKKANPDVSAASWAFRFVRELEGLVVILSGMGTLGQIEDNAKTINNFKPLSKDEHDLIRKAVEIINSTPRVPCTACRYCVPNCPKKIQIPAFIKIYNDLLAYKAEESSRYQYNMYAAVGPTPHDCAQCRSCEKHCPQHIEISDYMAKIADRF